MQLLVALAAAVLAVPLVAQDRLATLRPSHPRVMATEEDFERVRSLIESDATAKRLYGYIKSDADAILKQTPVQYVLVGPRLLDQSRRCLSRVYRLAFVFQIERDRKYLDRALEEMWAAANFKDWNPSHFLDTAEMTHAFAIGYSWLFNDLAEEQREWIRQAIVGKGLQPALQRYRLNGKGDGWWAVSPFNWNLVCNGGIAAGALAIAGEEPEIAREIVEYALKTAPIAMKSYAPEGGWAEGPGYWDYATRYACVLIQSLVTALGSDFGLPDMQGFDKAGYFRIFTSSPIGKTFNYADSGDGVGGSWPLLWLGRRFNQPTCAWFQLAQLTSASRTDPLDLIFFPAETALPDVLPSYAFQGVDVAILRTSWTDRDGIFIGIKGGDNAANHSHLDLGSFVFDFKGQRWAIDLGSDDYNLPDYFGKLRWTYYRLRSESHNTVLVENQNQNESGRAPIIDSVLNEDSSKATIDLKRAYPALVAEWYRTASIEEGRRAVFLDQIVARKDVDLLWGMVTDAQVELQGARAVLTKGNQTLTATIRAPESARFDIVSTTPADTAQNQNRGTRKLVVRLPSKVQAVAIEVAFE